MEEDRIESSVFIAFPACCMQFDPLLHLWRPTDRADNARKFAIQTIDIHLPTIDGRENFAHAHLHQLAAVHLAAYRILAWLGLDPKDSIAKIKDTSNASNQEDIHET